MRLTKTRVGVAAAGMTAMAAMAAVFLSGPSTINVDPGGDLQAAINSAQPGDTIVLQAGAKYVCAGGCVLPVKEGTEFVTIKSSRYEEIPLRAMASTAPAPETAKMMAHVTASFSTEPVFAVAPGAHHYKLLGLEITAPTGQATRLVEFGTSGASQDTLAEMPHHLVIDKSWLHGAIDQEVQRCLALNSSDTDVTNSWLTDCHGNGYDAQAIGGWNGGGNYRILNNALEGSGENFMLGGSPASIQGLIPTNVEFRGNYVWKSLSWYERDPSYAGRHWSVKNLFELKNARNVTVSGNIFDGNWTDAQAGRAIQFTPRPSDSGAWAVVEDVQFTNNIIRNTGAGINVLGADESNDGTVSTDTRLRRVRIANNLWEIDGARFGSDGVFLVVTNKTDEVTVENNTVIHTGNIISTDYAPNTRFIYRNNISRHNSFGIFGSGSGIGNPSIAQYFPGGVVTGNVMAKEPNGPGNAEALYPAGNFFPASLSTVLGADYRVIDPTYAGKGCDIDALNAALGGGSQPTPTVSPKASVSPVVTPSIGNESPNNTRIPTATQIIDSAGNTWTRLSDGIILRNAQNTGGVGSQLVYCNRTVHAFGTDSQWYKWSGSWQGIGASDPCGAVPSPTPVASPTAQPLPSPSPTATPRPSPTPVPCPALSKCASGAVIGDPLRCLCLTGVTNKGRCR